MISSEAALRPDLPGPRDRAPAHEAISPVDERPGRADDPQCEGDHRTGLLLRRSPGSAAARGGLLGSVRLCEAAQSPEVEDALRDAPSALRLQSRALPPLTRPLHPGTIHLGSSHRCGSGWVWLPCPGREAHRPRCPHLVVAHIGSSSGRSGAAPHTGCGGPGALDDCNLLPVQAGRTPLDLCR